MKDKLKEKACGKSLSAYFSNGQIYKIPEYQRSYTWSNYPEKMLDSFWEDLIMLGNEEENSLFFGSITVKYEKDLKLLVDGQQRTTTFLLLFKALIDFMAKDFKEYDDYENDKQELYKYIYKVEDGRNEKRIKITDIENNEKFKYLFEVEQPKFEDLQKIKTFPTQSLYHKNYFFFREKINTFFEENKEKEISFFLNIFKKIWIVLIELDEKDDELLIFESINSKGTSLNATDLIKNFLFIKSRKSYLELDGELQTFFTKHILNYGFLSDLSEEKKQKEFEIFIRKYIIYKMSSFEDSKSIVLPKASDPISLYNSFKQVVKNKFNNLSSKEDMNNLISDLKKSLNVQEFFYSIKQNEKTSNKTEYIVINLLYEEITGAQFLPLILQIADDIFEFDYEKKIRITLENFKDLILFIEKFYMRRSISDLGSRLITRTINKINISTFSEFKEKLENIDIPNDLIFEDGLKALNLGSKHRKLVKIILWRIESSLKTSPNDRISLEEFGNYTIEHIMPQTINWNDEDDEWRSVMSKEINTARIEYQENIDTIGNLTLTKDNTEMSNNSYTFKKPIFEDSKLNINREISKNEIWDIEKIKDRTDLLTKRALEIWK